jgi:transcriptional regulator of acetoin/glycerol metabolism
VSSPPQPKRKPARHLLSEKFAEPDLVDLIFDRFVAQFPEISQHSLSELKADMRAEVAGDNHYIPKRAPTERQRLVLQVLEQFNGRNASEVARRLGIGRSTVYRILKQPGRA